MYVQLHTHTHTHTHTRTHTHKHTIKGNGWADFQIFLTLKIFLEFRAHAQIRFCLGPEVQMLFGSSLLHG